MLRQWSYLTLCLLAVSLRVAGQGSNVTTCVSDYAWSINGLKQTPCLVAAYLESLCGTPTTVDSIPNGTHYLGPPTVLQADACKCSSVTYSAVSACGGCQGRTFQNWTTWSQNCLTVEISSFPQLIPDEVQVPSWMEINVTLNGNNFDPVIAQQVASSTSTPTSSIPQSSSSSISSSSSSTSAIDFPTQISDVAASTKKSNAGAIAGGVVAGLVVIALIVLFVLWKVIRKRRNAIQKDFSFNSKALISGTNITSHPTGTSGITSGTTGVIYSSLDGPSPVPYGGQSLYAPSEYRSAYPMSPTASSAIYTTPPERRSLESVSPSMMQLGGYQPQTTQPQGYRGAAELS